MKNENLSNSIIFPKGELIQNDYFIGDAFLQMLDIDTEIINAPTGNVTFSPGARNNWHIHEKGQVLIVTGGEGWYQEEGKTAQLLKTGNVINIPAGVKHWHGATKDSWFVHLAISPGLTTWLESVDDSWYNEL